jgi:hypothetical protein
MAEQDLAFAVAGDHPLAKTLADWAGRSPRFRTFLQTYRDKIRKKVRTAASDGGALDLLAELAVAFLLLRDRRLAVEYEKLGVGKTRAPDLTAIFKTHTLCHVEVTRLRNIAEMQGEANPLISKLAGTLCDKLGQLQPSAINLIALVQDEPSIGEAELQAAMRLLLARATAKDDAFFARRGLLHARAFQRQQLRLSGVFVCTLADPHNPQFTHLWLNPQAKHPLAPELKNLLRALD